MLAREPVPFWRENVVAVVTLLQVLAKMLKEQKQVIKINVRRFIILQSGESVTSFTKGNSANFSSEKW